MDDTRSAPSRNWRRLGVRCLSFLIVFVILGMILERQILYYPVPYSGGPEWSPEDLPAEDVFFESSGGTSLHGWYIPHPEPRALILYCHGNAGNISHRTPILRALHDQVGATVFIFDYRGYGRSGGTPYESGFYADARAARRWLAEKEGVDESEIVLLGRSLGGAVAVELASDGGAKALILESTFTSVRDMAKEIFPWVPRFLVSRSYDSSEKIGRYGGPLLQSHGDCDTIVPMRLGRELFDKASGKKTFYTVEGGNHNDMQPPEYYERMAVFLDELP